jgi:hypothetical protein
MRVSEKQTHKLAETVVGALLEQGFVHLEVGEQEITERIYRLLLDNFLAEEALEAEAEELAKRHARKMVGMDQGKIIQGIKDRLAK